MSEQIVIAATSLTAIAIVALAMLRGWQGWLSLKEHELEQSPSRAREIDTGSALGSISVPLSSTQDSLVKVASETIPAGEFYDRFFILMQRMLRENTSEH